MEPAAAAARPGSPEPEVFPLSFAQQRLWFIEQLDPNNAVYNLPILWRLKGPLNLAHLESALNEIIRRHPSLRTTFGEKEGQAVQRVTPFQPVTVQFVDVSGAKDPGAEAHRCIDQEVRTAFDLQKGPLFRAHLLRLGVDDHFALFNAHHIVWDGWSLELFRKEVTQVYEALESGSEALLCELPMQYGDFAVWQRESAQGVDWESQLRYWKEKLKAPLPVLELPADFPRPATSLFRGATRYCRFDDGVVKALRALSRMHGATLFMTMLAAFKVLLHRYARQDDVLVGSPMAGRDQPQTEGLIGFFVNTIALRTDLGGDPTFAGLLQRVKQVTFEAYENQSMPFERIVQELQPERSLNRNPIFQVLFGYERLMSENWPLGKVAAAAVPIDLGTSKFDLTFLLEETDAGLKGSLEFNTDLFEARTAERFLQHFQILLAGIAASPDRRISELPLMTDAERERVLGEWNRTEAPRERVGGVDELFEAQAARTPEAVALIAGEEQLSYRELNQRADALAAVLRERGVGADVPVALCVERSAELLVSILAVLKAGGAYLPLDPAYPAARLQQMIEIARPPILIATPALLKQTGLETLARFSMHVHQKLGVVQIAEVNDGVAPGGLDRLAYVIFTSGSTGTPKGVAMPHRPLANLIAWQLKHFAGPAAARTLQFASPGFDVSFQEMFSTWCAGGTLVMVTEEMRRDLGLLWRFIGSQRIERLFVPFVVLQQLAEAAVDRPELTASLREVITAGEQLRITPQIAALFHRLPQCALTNHYGPSETHVVTSFTLTGSPDDWPVLPPIGKPIENTAIYVLDAQRQPVPIGVPGEIYIGGQCVARGYLHRADLTAEKFVDDPIGAGNSSPVQSVPDSESRQAKARRCYRTGDLGRWRADGNLEFLGRMDHQLKIRGFRVEPGEIEAVLAEHPDIREAAVVALPDKSGGRQLVAYVVAGQTGMNAPHDFEAGLRTFLESRLPSYMVPACFVQLERLPVTTNGKLDRRALPAPAPAERQAAALTPPRTAIEQRVADIWIEILGHKAIGIHDNFFHLGGHSLLATQVMSRIGKALQVDVPVRVLFEAPTIAALAERIQSLPASRRSNGNGIARRIKRAEAQQLLAQLDKLSEAQIEELLRSTELNQVQT